MASALHRLLHPPHAALLLALASAGILLAALGLEYSGVATPCQLCTWQRYPYLAVIGLGLLGYWWHPRLMLGVTALVLIGNAGLAGYHVGIEQGWFALPSGCAAGTEATSVDQLRELLAAAPPACDQVSFTFFGLSLAAWNIVTCLALACYAAATALGLERRTAQDRLAPTRG